MTKIGANFSDYIVFADESGDHGISSINPANPIFVLAFCIFKKSDYISLIKNAVAKLKLHFWGHDLVVLHNREIRKSMGAFSFLFNEEARRIFMHSLNEMMRLIPFSIVATAIDKRQHTVSSTINNPYSLALESCVAQTISFLEEKQQLQHLTHLVVESRGKPEDRELELTFRSIPEQTQWHEQYPLEIKFASKQTNSSGLQIADLVAHPIAKHAMKKDLPNKAFDIIKDKLLGYPSYEDIGLKYQSPESEKPRQSPRLDADEELPIHL